MLKHTWHTCVINVSYFTSVECALNDTVSLLVHNTEDVIACPIKLTIMFCILAIVAILVMCNMKFYASPK